MCGTKLLRLEAHVPVLVTGYYFYSSYALAIRSIQKLMHAIFRSKKRKIHKMWMLDFKQSDAAHNITTQQPNNQRFRHLIEHLNQLSASTNYAIYGQGPNQWR